MKNILGKVCVSRLRHSGRRALRLARLILRSGPEGRVSKERRAAQGEGAKLGSSLALALLGIGLAGCGGADLVEHDYRLRHPIHVEQRTAILDIESVDEDQERITAFAFDFLKASGDGKVVVTVSGRTADDSESITLAQDIGATLRGLGLAAGEIDLRLAVHEVQRRAVLTYVFYFARSPQCGTWTKDIADNSDNAPSEHFGCAIQRNLGAMVSNPRDLIRMQGDQGRWAGRSADAVNKYERGQAIAAPKEVKTSTSK